MGKLLRIDARTSAVAYFFQQAYDSLVEET